MVDRLTPFSSGLYSYSPCTACQSSPGQRNSREDDWFASYYKADRCRRSHLQRCECFAVLMFEV
jgi:hypothetical protein